MRHTFRATGFLIALTAFGTTSFPSTTAAYEPADSNLIPAAREVLDYFESIYKTKTIGASGDPTYFKSCSGRMPGIIEADLGGLKPTTRWSDRYATAVSNRMAWLKDLYYSEGIIPQVVFHWPSPFGTGGNFNDTQVDLTEGRFDSMVTPGTAAYDTMLNDFGRHADYLQQFHDEGIPLLWRPLHEIDGGWFWWTNKAAPENTAELWRILYDYLVNQRGFHNLIWVYSTGMGHPVVKDTAYRNPFYPGAQYVDIAGIDLYGDFMDDGIDNYNDTTQSYRDAFEMMEKVAPGKMVALTECDAVPDMERTYSGDSLFAPWLWARPWWTNYKNPCDYIYKSYTHEGCLTLEEMPYLGTGSYKPQVGITSPVDDGSGWFTGDPEIKTFAVDRGGSIDKVLYYANDVHIGTGTGNSFTWADAPAGTYRIHVKAIDNDGDTAVSAAVRIGVKTTDLAKGKPVTASTERDSSANAAANAVDGDYHTDWSPADIESTINTPPNDSAWIYVDLEGPETVGGVNLLWGYKVYASKFAIDVATDTPENDTSWNTVYRDSAKVVFSELVYWNMEHRVSFSPVTARYVRLRVFKRAAGETWGPYNLAAFEVPADIPELVSRITALPAAPAASPGNHRLYSITGRPMGTAPAPGVYLSVTATGMKKTVIIP